MSQFPSGLAYSQLSASYRHLHGEVLDPLTCGLELCCQLPDVVQIQSSWMGGGTGCCYLSGLHTHRGHHSTVGSRLTDHAWASWLTGWRLSNHQPLGPADYDYEDVMVTAVRSPSKLYVQLRNMQDKLYKLAMSNGIRVGEEGELRPMEAKVSSTDCQPRSYQSAWHCKPASPAGQVTG